MGELRVVRAGELSTQTAQTPGMTRYAGVAAGTVGSQNLWMGYSTMAPGARSGAHHHGDYESAIYVIRGRARFRFGELLERSVEVGPGDFLYVPPRAIHQEINVGSEAAEMIVCRSGQENVVVNVELPEAIIQGSA